MDPSSPLYPSWYQEHVSEPVEEKQFQKQVTAAKGHLQMAQFHRVVGDMESARRSLSRAGAERSIAARMPRVRPSQ